MELSKNHEPIGGIETSHALNWELPSFNSNYANDDFNFVYEALGAASGATKYKNVNTNSKNRSKISVSSSRIHIDQNHRSDRCYVEKYFPLTFF